MLMWHEMLQYIYWDRVTVISKAKAIVALETKLAKAMLSKREL
ncbi:MAG: hypothetical protein ABI045_05200 [Flavobacteriales bacterium]